MKLFQKCVAALLLAALLLLAGCQPTGGDTSHADDSMSDGETVTAAARYIRTNQMNGEASFPTVRLITSAEALKDYYAKNRELFDLGRKQAVYADTTAGFLDACDGYDDAFFEKNYLILLILEENSGSIRHKMEAVKQTGDDKMQIFVERTVPEVGTDDMAQWHVILELSRDAWVKEPGDILLYLDGRLAWDGAAVAPPRPEPAFKKPPGVTVVTPDTQQTLKAAGYDWTFADTDGSVTAIIADQSGRPSEKRFFVPVMIDPKQAETVYAYDPDTGRSEPVKLLGHLVKLEWESLPDTVTYTCWPDAVWTTGGVSPREVYAQQSDAFYAYQGGHVYEIVATWEDTGAGWYGRANYYVYIVG